MSRVVIGAPVYNGGEYLPAAIESLLAQTHRDFRLVLVDDGSTDGTVETIEHYARVDERVHVERNPQRLGMTRNWRRAFRVAQSVAPDMRYFAWASDHDLWAPEWLESLLAAFEADPALVLAYPRAVGFSDVPENVVHRPRGISTAGTSARRTRMLDTWYGMSAGYMVYGLFRAEALERCGVFRSVRDPDRLLMFELAAHGTFEQVPETLFFRRRATGKPSSKRQMANFFPGRRRPLYTYLPWPALHAGMVGWSLAVRGNGRPRIGRVRGVALAAWYLWLGCGLEARRQIRLGQRSQLAPVRAAALLAGRVVNPKPTRSRLAAGPKKPKELNAAKKPKGPKSPKVAKTPTGEEAKRSEVAERPRGRPVAGEGGESTQIPS